MEFDDLDSMSLDELWALHQALEILLSKKLSEEKRAIEKRLAALRSFTLNPRSRHGPKRHRSSGTHSTQRKRGPDGARPLHGSLRSSMPERQKRIYSSHT